MTRTDIVALSDVHWGASDSLHEEFREFLTSYLERKPTRHLVLLGDIVDFWRMNKEECFMSGWQLREPLSVIKERGYAERIHFIIGNHDCNFQSLMGSVVHDFDIRKSIRLKSGDRKFFFIHGHQLEYRRARRLFDWIGCPFLVGVGGTIIGRQLDSVWNYFDRKLRPRIKRSIAFLKKKTNPSVMKLSLKEINKLIELLYLDSLGPHEIKSLTNHMMAPLKQRISMPLLGKDFFSAQEWVRYQTMQDKPKLPLRKAEYDPTSFYRDLFDKREMKSFDISSDDALKNIIGPIDFRAFRENYDYQDIDIEEWDLKESVFQLLDAVLLLGNNLYKMRDTIASRFLDTMVFNILGNVNHRQLNNSLQKGLSEFKEKISEKSSWKDLQEKIIENVVGFVPSNTGGIVERAESCLGLQNDETLVYGHTHVPLKGDRLINTGSWMRSEDRDYKTYFVIDRGRIEGPLVYH